MHSLSHAHKIPLDTPYNNHDKICTPEMVSDYTHPSFAKPHANPFPTDATWAFQALIEAYRKQNIYLKLQ